MIDRRQFLAWAATVTVAGCGNPATDVAVAQQVVADVTEIASGLAGALPSLAKSPVFAQISYYVALLQQYAGAITTATPVSSAQSTVQNIESVLNTILQVTATLALPTPFGPALQAAAFLLPIIEQAVGLLVSKPAVVTMSARLSTTMTPDQARQILANAAQGR